MLLERYSYSYEGRSINKLQNSVVLLVFQITEIWNVCFVANFSLSNSCDFYYDDVSVTSFKYGDIDTEILP